MQLEGKNLNFLGDSITEGTGASCAAARYVDRVAQMSGAVCRNYGVCGTRIVRQTQPSAAARHDLDFCMRAETMDPDANAVVVFGGTNDFGHGDAPLGVMSDRTPYTFCGALHTLYRSLLTRFPRAAIVVLTPLHRCDEELSAEKPPHAAALPLRSYVAAIREAAEYYSLPLLDLYAASGLQPSVPAIGELYFTDGLHPSDMGHAVVADKIVQFLRAL